MGSRIRVRARLCAAVAALCLAAAACDGSAGENDSSSTAPSDPRTNATHEAALVDAPEVGTCWQVPASNALDSDYWFDDSTVVDCSEPHTTETAEVIRLTDPTVAEASEYLNLCGEYARTYLGVDPASWVPWGGAAYLPSREQVADGASWMRCDAMLLATWDGTRPRETTGSAAGAADDPPAELWACLDQHPRTSDQPFVPCDRPHAYEQTGQLAILDGLATYPKPAELAAQARQQCDGGVPDALEGRVELTAVWDPRSALKEDTSIAGACFMYTKTGRPLPARN
jgi:hypothetical protein